MRKIIDIKKNNKFIINTPNYILKLLDKSHVSKKYLGWLNDKKTSEFTYRRDKIFNLIDIRPPIAINNVDIQIHIIKGLY